MGFTDWFFKQRVGKEPTDRHIRGVERREEGWVGLVRGFFSEGGETGEGGGGEGEGRCWRGSLGVDCCSA